MTFQSIVGWYHYPAKGAARRHAPSCIRLGASCVPDDYLTCDAAGKHDEGPRPARSSGMARTVRSEVTTEDGTTKFSYGPDGSRWEKTTPTALRTSCEGTPADTVIYSFGPELERKVEPLCANGQLDQQQGDNVDEIPAPRRQAGRRRRVCQNLLPAPGRA